MDCKSVRISTMNICVTVNSNYVRYLYTMLLSLYENNKKGSICLYVIQRDFTEEDKRTIRKLTNAYKNHVEYIWVDERKFDTMAVSINERKNLSLEIYFRLLIPEFIPVKVNRVLMLDVDIVVNNSIEELYTTDMEGKCLAAAPNMCHNFIVKKFFRMWYPQDRISWIHYNTGILLWDLKKIREQYPEEYLFQQASKYKIGTSTFEEELINVEFGENNVLALDPLKWNYITTHEDRFMMPGFNKYQSLEELRKACHIVHYAAMNPWEVGCKNKGFTLWWEYARKTPYYLEFLEEQLNRMENYICDEQNKKKLEKETLIDFQIINQMNKFQSTSELYAFLKYEDANIYIWGTGKMGNRLYQLFESVQLQEKIIGVIDWKKSGEFHGMKIRRYEDILDDLKSKTYKIIVTPVKNHYELVSEIDDMVQQNIKVVALADYLNELGTE